MAKLLVSFEVSKGYAQWKSGFDRMEESRSGAGIKTIYAGHELENESKVHVLMDVRSLEEMDEYMKDPKHGPVVEEAGNIVDSTVVIVLSD